MLLKPFFLAISFLIATIPILVAETPQTGTSRQPHRPNAVSGDLVLEDTTQKVQTPKAAGQRMALEWTQALKASVEKGTPSTITAPEDAALNYLATVYLYCLHKRGPCPFILDAILEADVIAARSGASKGCPIMTRFWKMWLANELEQRARYLLSIGSGAAVSNFNAVERPKYLRCTDTVVKIVGEGAASARYGATGTSTRAVTQTAGLLNDIKGREIDVFSAVGVKVEGEKSKQKELE
jgi:hypothetical protein